METESIDKLFLELSQFTTAATAREQMLFEQNSNLATLVIRLARRVRGFESECKVAAQAMDYLRRNELVPSIIRQDEAIPKFCPHADPHVYCNGCKVSPCPVGLD